MEYVVFNTKEKAVDCFKKLGKRGAYIMRFSYAGDSSGYYVYYFKKRG